MCSHHGSSCIRLAPSETGRQFTRLVLPKTCQPHRQRVMMPLRAQSTSDDAATTSSTSVGVASSSTSVGVASSSASGAAAKYNWTFDPETAKSSRGRIIQDIPVALIRRPLGKTRANDGEKVEALMQSITEIGLQEPIDVLEVEGQYYGFSGCHRYEAHQRLGLETIRCRVRKATKDVLKMHMM